MQISYSCILKNEVTVLLGLNQGMQEVGWSY